MVARALHRNALKRAIECGDAQIAPVAVLLQIHGRDEFLLHVRQESVIYLHIQPSINDSAIFRTQRIRELGNGPGHNRMNCTGTDHASVIFCIEFRKSFAISATNNHIKGIFCLLRSKRTPLDPA